MGYIMGMNCPRITSSLLHLIVFSAAPMEISDQIICFPSDQFVSAVFHILHVGQLLLLSPLLLGSSGLGIDTHDLLVQTLLFLPLLLQGLEELDRSDKKWTPMQVYRTRCPTTL